MAKKNTESKQIKEEKQTKQVKQAKELKQSKQIKQVREKIEKRVRREFGVTADAAAASQIFKASALCVRDEVMDRFAQERSRSENKDEKCVVYLCAEFLIGRAFSNNLVNLGMYDTYAAALKEMGYDIAEIEEQEADAGLGNGGLGRLAACFLDSLSTLNMPVIGCGIRYKYGFFRQEIHDGQQVEVSDNWTLGGDVWSVPRADRLYEIKFGGEVIEEWSEDGKLKVDYEGSKSVYAEAYDMPIVGYKSERPATLRLWRTYSPQQLDLHKFNQGDYAHAVAERELAESISEVLYPEDSHESGQELRLRQFYFLASATMQSLVEAHKRQYGDLASLPDKISIQINDTHPTLAIPELIRILIDEEDFTWEQAMDIVSRTFNYTNHTVMPEALEKWPAGILQRLLPRIYRIVETIDAQFRDRIWRQFPGDFERVNRMAVVHAGKVHMANLCVLCCCCCNGVSQMHGEILKKDLFKDFYEMSPQKFLGITNGITQRRWLGVANPELTQLINDTLGCDCLADWKSLKGLTKYAKDKSFQKAFRKIKQRNKNNFAKWVLEMRGTIINPHSIFDVQAKRIHEYKRQLMKALHIIMLYDKIKDGTIKDFTPTTFIFAGKAAPGYYRAKQIIRLINSLSTMILADEDVRDLIPVFFLENYDVSAAQHIVAAADISEQISTAGKEASGTGNMKFMINGALTLGTLDGANVEIAEQVGDDNIFIFGANEDELNAMRAANSYNTHDIVLSNPDLGRVLQHLIDGSLPTSDGSRFDDLYHALLDEGDQYFILHDFASYNARFFDVVHSYKHEREWYEKSIMNTACAGFFSSDRAIEEYDEKIWYTTSHKC